MRKNKIQPNIKFLGSKNLKKFQNIHHFGGGENGGLKIKNLNKNTFKIYYLKNNFYHTKEKHIFLHHYSIKKNKSILTPFFFKL